MTDKFDAWRESENKRIPEAARRVFALREVGYKGCGFHYDLEHRLGIVIAGMNEHSDYYFDESQDIPMRRAVLRSHVRRLWKDIEQAEKSAQELSQSRRP